MNFLRRSQFSLLTCFVIVSGSTAMAGVDPALLRLVMPDAQTLSGGQFDQAQASPLGQFLLSRIQADAGFNKLLTATGFDPRHDLHEVLAASPAGTTTGLILIKGTFQPSKLSAAAVTAGATRSTYQGIEILSSPQGNDMPGCVAFLDNTTVILGDPATVKAAIDRKIFGAAYSGDLLVKAQSASAGNQFWFASLNPPVNLGANKIPNANLLQSVQQTSAGVSFSAAGVMLSADLMTRSPQDAQALVDVVKFVISMVQSGSQNKGPEAASVATLLASAKVNTAGSSMQLALTVPELQAEQLLMPRK